MPKRKTDDRIYSVRVYLNDKEYRALAKYSFITGMPMSVLVRRRVFPFLEKDLEKIQK